MERTSALDGGADGKKSKQGKNSFGIELFWTALSFFLIAVVFACDFYTKERYSFFLFYILPLIVLSRHGFMFAGYAAVLLGTALWFAAALNATKPLPLDVVCWNAFTRFSVFSYIVWLSLRWEKIIKKEKELSRKDSLTGALNRQAFYEKLDVERWRSKRYKRPLSLLYLDIDSFKQINDQYGHARGNEVLIKFAETIRSQIRLIDVLARLGGDEFVVLLPETREDGAKQCADRIKDAAVRLMEVQTSVGAVTYNSVLDTNDQIIDAADRLMYLDKNSKKKHSGGKNHE